METQSHIPAIAAEIKKQLACIEGESLANSLRCAALFVHMDFPTATSSDFGDAAASLGMHRQAAMNRWNESKQIEGDDW